MFNRNNRMKMDDLRYKIRWDNITSIEFDTAISLADNLRKFKDKTSNVLMHHHNAYMFKLELGEEYFVWGSNHTLWSQEDGANVNWESNPDTFTKDKLFLATEDGIVSLLLPKEYYTREYYGPYDPLPFFPKKECGHPTYAFCDCWRASRIDGKPQLQRKPCYHLVNKECDCTIR